MRRKRRVEGEGERRSKRARRGICNTYREKGNRMTGKGGGKEGRQKEVDGRYSKREHVGMGWEETGGRRNGTGENERGKTLSGKKEGRKRVVGKREGEEGREKGTGGRRGEREKGRGKREKGRRWRRKMGMRKGGGIGEHGKRSPGHFFSDRFPLVAVVN
jgi:hypothetical protein